MLDEDKNKLLSTSLSDKMSELGIVITNNNSFDAGMDYVNNPAFKSEGL